MPKARITLDVDFDTLEWYDKYAKDGHKISRNELVRKAMEYYEIN